MSAESIEPQPSHPAFETLAEDLTWFIECPEIRVLHVTTSEREHPVVVRQVTLAEGHGSNKSPFFVLEDDGWAARAKEVLAIHEERRKLLAEEGYALGAVPPVAQSQGAFIETAFYLERCLEAQHEIDVLDGLVVVLAPTENEKGLADNILSLVRTPSLARVRYIVVELGNELLTPLESALGEAMMSAECVEDAAGQEQDEALAAAAAAPVDAPPEVSAGGAGAKHVITPPRSGKPPRDKEESEEAGAEAALLGEQGAILRQRVLGAALAVREQRFDEAVTLQKEAVKQCTDAGLIQQALIFELVLANYLLQTGDKKQSRATFESVASRSEGAGCKDVATQAHLALGAILAMSKDFEGSMRHYVQAASLAEKEAPLLAIEAYRAAGQIALPHSEKAAVEVWNRALAIAKAAPPQDVAHSGAPVVARALAKVMQNNRSFDAAKSLLAQADEYEAMTANPDPHGAN